MSFEELPHHVRALAGAIVLILLLSITMVATADGDALPRRDESASVAKQPGVARVPAVPGDGAHPSGSRAQPAPVPRDVPAEVTTRRPDLLIRSSVRAASDVLTAVRQLDDVTQAVAVHRFDATLQTHDGDVAVTVVAVDPWSFRPLTPDVTAQTPAVWERLIAGDVMIRHDLTYREGLELGDSYRLVGAAGTRTVRFGALATSGVPPIADIVVPLELGAQLHGERSNLVLAAIAEGVEPRTVKRSVLDSVEDVTVELREELIEHQARLLTGSRVPIEPFTYTDVGDGSIIIDRAWVEKWIVSVDLPYLGRAHVHRAMAYQLTEALDQIGAEGLSGHLDREQFAGVWVPRHMQWDPNRGISMHAWGLAIDINSRDNCMRCTPTLHPRIVQIFKDWGFIWGGDWDPPDGMHFEFARSIAPPD